MSGCRQRRPVQIRLHAEGGMTRDEGHTSTNSAVSERYLSRRCAPEGGGNAGNDFHPDSRRPERFELLAASSKNERIASLETHDSLSLTRGLYQLSVDVVLGHRMFPSGLADINDARPWPDQLEHARAHNPVTEDDVSRLNYPDRP
jgi:hypothetical protein